MSSKALWLALLVAGCSAEQTSVPAADGVDAAAPDAAPPPMGTAGGAGAPPALASDVEAMCDSFAALPCGKTKEQCVADATELIDVAAAKGCSAEYDALLACAAKKTATCAAGGGIALPGCEPEIAGMDACDPPSVDCVGADVPGISCSKNCQTWGAACSETASGLQCSCTLGPHTGEAFELAGACVPGWDALAKQHFE